MADGTSINSSRIRRLRQAVFQRQRGIGFRVSLYLSAVLVLAVALAAVLFYRHDKKSLDDEIRSRALYMAQTLAAVATDDFMTGNRDEITRIFSRPFSSNDNNLPGTSLLYLAAYDRNCKLLLSRTITGLFPSGNYFLSALPPENGVIREETAFACGPETVQGPVFDIKKNGVYDLILPVTAGNDKAGYIRLGMLGPGYEQRFSGGMDNILIACLIILLVGIAFSRIIANQITKPILKVCKAVDALRQQNGDMPFSESGSDEIGRLSHAFNQMALSLKQRDEILSHGNRDLFLLHTVGLDLMESLERDSLLSKIAARLEDLVRADTTAISMVDTSGGMLNYLAVFGSKAKALTEREAPIETGGIYNWLASYGTPLLIPDAEADFRLDSVLMRSLGFKSIMTVPLWSSNTMTGLLTAVNKQGGGEI